MLGVVSGRLEDLLQKLHWYFQKKKFFTGSLEDYKNLQSIKKCSMSKSTLVNKKRG